MKSNVFTNPLWETEKMSKTIFDNCLTYEQLQNYSLNRSVHEEKARIYQHISNCELCACAVNGFTAVPFTFADVDAIQQHINVRTNAAHANPLTFVQALIVTVSVASIFGFYKFTESFSDKEAGHVSVEAVQPLVVSEPKPEVITPSETDKQLAEERPEMEKSAAATSIAERQMISVEPFESIAADLIQPAMNPPEILSEPSYNADVIYIYDLKITNYSNLYFSYKIKPFEIKGHTPSFKENKESADYLLETEETVAADRVLKSAVAHFTKGKYSKALTEFELLLENNPKDVNSLFYSAVAYYQLGRYTLTIKNLEAVLQNPNNVFHPEAKWNLSLANLKAGNRSEAKQLLTEIADEKGFYSKRAGEKLKGL